MNGVRCLTLLVAGLTAASCRYPNQFESAPRNAPHAVLRATEYPGAGHIFASHVNGQPVSFWRSGKVIRIPAGTNTCRVAYSDRQETHDFEKIVFVALAGHEYEIVRQRQPGTASSISAAPRPATSNAWIVCDARDLAALRETVPGGSPKVIAEGRKVAYIFGIPSRDLAIAEYRKTNP
jgi:hypothetical protein